MERRKRSLIDVAVPALIAVLVVLISIIGGGMISALNSLTAEVRNLSAELAAVKANQQDASRRQDQADAAFEKQQMAIDTLSHDVQQLQYRRPVK